MNQHPKQIRTLTTSILLLPCLFVSFLVPLAAQHLEDSQIALGRAEHKLSSINVYGTPIAEVLKTYGEPTTQKDLSSDSNSPTRQYTWERVGLRMTVTTKTRNHVDHKQVEEVICISVWGEAAQKRVGLTGAGLGLGSTFQQQKAAYGSRFLNSSPNRRVAANIQIEWKDGTRMQLDYSPKGLINHIELCASTE